MGVVVNCRIQPGYKFRQRNDSGMLFARMPVLDHERISLDLEGRGPAIVAGHVAAVPIVGHQGTPANCGAPTMAGTAGVCSDGTGTAVGRGRGGT